MGDIGIRRAEPDHFGEKPAQGQAALPDPVVPKRAEPRLLQAFHRLEGQLAVSLAPGGTVLDLIVKGAEIGHVPAQAFAAHGGFGHDQTFAMKSVTVTCSGRTLRSVSQLAAFCSLPRKPASSTA